MFVKEVGVFKTGTNCCQTDPNKTKIDLTKKPHFFLQRNVRYILYMGLGPSLCNAFYVYKFLNCAN